MSDLAKNQSSDGIPLDDGATAATATPGRYSIASTVSPQSAQQLAALYESFQAFAPLARPRTAADWRARWEIFEERIGPIGRAAAEQAGVSLEDDVLGGVPVLRVRPPNPRRELAPLIYVHGGAYVIMSTRSALAVPSQVAAASGQEVISIEYTLAPAGDWRSATAEVLRVWKALLEGGATPGAIGSFGDSAGGGLATGAVLRMRDEGLPLPGALYLLSPWSDITATGDLYAILAPFDPSLTIEELAWAADAYADPADQEHPYVSAVHGEYGDDFPPTLIQVGTREMFLSHAVRLYQAIGKRGTAILDAYEGMPHVHPGLIPGAPESVDAIAKAVAFFEETLMSNGSGR